MCNKKIIGVIIISFVFAQNILAGSLIIKTKSDWIEATVGKGMVVVKVSENGVVKKTYGWYQDRGSCSGNCSQNQYDYQLFEIVGDDINYVGVMPQAFKDNYNEQMDPLKCNIQSNGHCNPYTINIGSGNSNQYASSYYSPSKVYSATELSILAFAGATIGPIVLEVKAGNCKYYWLRDKYSGAGGDKYVLISSRGALMSCIPFDLNDSTDPKINGSKDVGDYDYWFGNRKSVSVGLTKSVNDVCYCMNN